MARPRISNGSGNSTPTLGFDVKFWFATDKLRSDTLLPKLLSGQVNLKEN